jgi:hypothetical protein
MTMLSFHVEDEEAARVQAWAEKLGVDRSELLREAVHRFLVKLASEANAPPWTNNPLGPEEHELAAVADWGPAEEWSDWDDAAR